MHRGILVATLSVCAAACTSVKSNDIETAGMSAHITVTADGQGHTGAVAEINVDDNPTDFVDLTPGDSLVATAAGSASQSMARSDLLGIISYGASFTGQDAPGTNYTVAFHRAAPAVSAPSSTCTLPQPFSITTVATNLSLSRANDAVVVTYSNPGQSDAMTYLVTGDCLTTLSGSLPTDSGTVTIAKGTVTPSGASSNASSSCTATLTIRRSRAGQLDSAFGYGGGISCNQARTITFVSNP
jgi:hypothetical protein